MNRRSALLLLLLHSLVFVIKWKTCEGKRPHILIVIGDDMGWNDVGFHGNNALKTPNVDALAYNGIILNRHYASPTCTPSRAALFTGNYPIRSGLQGWPIPAGENRSLPHRMRTMPEHLKALGYATHLVGKWHLGAGYKNVTPTRRGFDTHYGFWNGYVGYRDYVSPSFHFKGIDMHDGFEPVTSATGRYATDLFTDRAERLVADHDPAVPLFLVVSHLAAHTVADGRELGVRNATANAVEFARIAVDRRRQYAGLMKAFDESLARIVDRLATKRMLNDTIVLLFSDNGGPTVDEFNNTASNWPLRGVKGSVTEGGVRTLAAIWSARFIHRGYVSNELVHLVDWLPTLYAAAGGDVRDLGRIDGRNQWSVLSHKLASTERNVLVHMDEVRSEAAVIANGTYKLINVRDYKAINDHHGSEEKTDYPEYDCTSVLESAVNRRLSAFGRALSCDDVRSMRSDAEIASCANRTTVERNLRFALFDIVVDPCETRNVADERPDVVDALKETLFDYERSLVRQQNNAPDPCSNPAYYGGYWSTWLSDPSPDCRGKGSETRII